ncbi:MAG: ATP-binding protein [Actinomycetota bacterium]|nr:ATP-binding protein [Actinomycetota bacterium]
MIEDATRRTVASNQLARSPFGEVTGDALAGAVLSRAMAQARAGHAGSEALDLHGPQPRRLEVTASPLPDGGVVAVLVDATERRRLDAVRRDFIANVNHELRTPIGALGVLAEALSGQRDQATLDRLAGRISMEVDRARALIEDLLEFSRVEADLQRTREPVALADVVEMASARVSASAEQKGVHLDLPDRAGLPTLVGDREQLVTAVANLLDNAVKYSEAGTTVRVTVSSEDEAVVIAVTDEGIGIPARDLDRIFERFYRVDAARDRRTGGTGLGLAIVRHVATNHGGTVSVRSQEGMGSTFTLRLPSMSGSS